MIRKVSLVGALFLMLILGTWIGDRFAQNRNYRGEDDSKWVGTTGDVSDNTAGADLFGGFDPLWDDDIYMVLAGLQRSGVGSDQQRGVRDPGRRGGNEPQRRRTWAEIIDTDELLAFLREHEPRMASSLEWQKNNNEERFNSQVAAYKEIYGPVIQQMKRDPESGKLSVKKVRLNFYITWSVSDVKQREEGSERYKSALERLNGHVADAFDVIIEEQLLHVRRMEERIKDRPENTQEQAVQGERGRGGQRGGFNPVEFRQEIEKRKKDIQSWQTKKDKIVQERVEDLLQDHPNFPWGD